MSYFLLVDQLGNQRYLSATDLTAAGFPTSFTVSSANDTTAPSLVSFDVSPIAVNTTSGPAAVSFTARLTDDLAGVAGAGYTSSPTQVRFVSPSGGQFVDALFTHLERISGTALDGIYTSSATIPQFAEAGTWRASYFLLVDQVGNQRYLSAADLTAAGFLSTLLVNSPVVPTISIVTPPDGAVYAIGQAVIADYSCSDAIGIHLCGGTVPNGSPIDTATPGTHTFTVFADNDAGNSTSVSVTYTVIELPTITIDSPTSSIYDRGAVVIAQYACQHAVTCAGDVPSGSALDTSASGEKTFTVTATDALGNVTTETVTYTVSLGACVAPFDGLTAWLPGDGSAVDRITGASAIWTGPQTYATGMAAQSFSVGGGNYASLPFQQGGPFSLQAWIRTPDRLQPEFTGVISTGGPGQNATSLQIELDGSGNYRLNVGDSEPSLLIGPALDQFQHVAVTFDGSFFTVYLNGQFVERAAWTGSPGIGFHLLNVGIDRDGTRPFTGTIDEVQVFDRALTAFGVSQSFLAGSAGFCKNRPPTAVAMVSPTPPEATGPSGAAMTLDGGASTDPDGDALTYLWTEGSTTLSTATAATVMFPIGPHTVTLTVSDGVASASTTISFVVRDTMPPSLTLPGAMTVEATSAAGAIVTFAVDAGDAVDGATPVICSPASGSIFPLGNTIVSCTATDADGNSAGGLVDVTVQDTTAPSTITYRTGTTPVPDGTWTPFTSLGSGGTPAGSSRYMQFAVQMNSTSGTKTPLIQDVTVQFKR